MRSGRKLSLMTFQQQAIGIDIGAGYVKILQLRKAGGSFAVKNYTTHAIPAAVRDNAQEKQKVAAGFIKEFMDAAHIKACTGKLAVYGKGVYVFFLSVPHLNKKDLRGAVGIELKKRLPPQSDINSMAYDYFINGSAQDQAAPTLQVTCVAVDRSLIEEQIALLKGLNIHPVSIQVIPDALGNLLTHCVNTDPAAPVALLDLGAGVSLLNFYKGKSLVFSREIPIGGEHITAALLKGLSMATGVTGITADDAEKIKRSCGIPLAEDAKSEYMTDFGVVRGEQLLAMVRPVIERLVMEISRTFNYYSKTFKTGAIGKLYLTGGSSRLKNIATILQANVEGLKSAEQLSILSVIKGWSDKSVLRQEMMMEQAAPHLAAAFGMCLGAGGKINMLPVRERIEQKIGIFTAMVQVFFSLACVITMLLYASSYANGLKYKSLAVKLEGQVRQLEASSGHVKKYLALRSQLERKHQLLDTARGRQPMWWGILKELSVVTPDDVVLRMINVPLNTEPKEMRIFGRISSKQTIVDMALSQYVQALDDSPFFSNARILSSDKDLSAPVPTADFTIVCRLEY
ncbi:MAG TPA: pilus assembly protein PilM [Candidatus Omnitrophota bacterium]|nr:pilus assembly protein PilM [Candidatus Omnitrophota bacterium]